MASSSTHKAEIPTYRRIRQAIGYLGVGLPIALILLTLIPFFDTKFQPSISHYYYTNLRELFTGCLCAVGLFMIRYQGFGNMQWWKNDGLLTNIAGYMAFGVALVPTNPLDGKSRIWTLIPYDWNFLTYVHYGFAAILFVCFSILAISVFTMGQKRDVGVRKWWFNENNIYRFCGYSILVFIVLVPISEKFAWSEHSTFVLEALSLFAFGIAWLIKGRALGDKGLKGEILYCERN
jgi:hypothetical protein